MLDLTPIAIANPNRDPNGASNGANGDGDPNGSKKEQESLRHHLGTLEWGEHSKYLSHAFTEQGVAMLSSVLRSNRALQVNIEIMRAFVRLREILATHEGLAKKLETLERKYDAQFKVVFDAIRQLMIPPEPKKRKIGFLVRERAAKYGHRSTAR